MSRGFALIALGLVVAGVSAYVRGNADSYHNEKSRFLLLAVAMFVQAVTDEFKSFRIRMAMSAVSMALMAAVFWLTFR
jgi:hypothetical protein